VKQVLQNLRSGETEVVDVPAPAPQRGQVLIRTHRTLVSTGTERMLVEFGQAGWIDKVRQQPDKVRMVLEKIRTDGLLPTIDAVLNKLDQPLPLGYCNVGSVLDAGAGVSGLPIGARVVSNGPHAEVVRVPSNLCARVPDGVTDDSAAFTVVAAIGLQGVRLAMPTLGESFVVTGLGLIGLITVQLLRAHGCRVLGIDFDPARLAMARRFGAETVDLSAGADPISAADSFSRGRGVDGVIITAATKSNEPMHQAARMCRKRGRIVLVGVAGLELSRTDFYEKELSFQVSCSYGPGRYDPAYEQRGADYPFGFVRWTAQRNFEAVLDMMASGQLDVVDLVSHRFSIEDASRAYDVVTGDQPSLGILLEYSGTDAAATSRTLSRSVAVRTSASSAARNGTHISVIGTGNYAKAVLIPAFKDAGAHLRSVASSGGLNGLHAARKFEAVEATTDVDALLADPSTAAVVIATRHDTHATLATKSLRAGKHTFVEKPLALTIDELDEVEQSVAVAQRVLTVGFNRRFAPHVQAAKELLAGIVEPKTLVVTVNAGSIPAEHWTQDAAAGGGRIAGEACHFVDLLRFLVGAPITGFDAISLGGVPTVAIGEDKATITLRFADGSFGTIHYFANGHKAFPKERIEVFAAGRVLQIDNFRRMHGYGWPRFRSKLLWRQDKGQRECVAAFLQAIATGCHPIPLDELFEVSRVTIQIAESLRKGVRA
jgi:predicted dehydrogenase/threonine dehydrogenase-like Zn-dependent dehydrogenase